MHWKCLFVWLFGLAIAVKAHEQDDFCVTSHDRVFSLLSQRFRKIMGPYGKINWNPQKFEQKRSPPPEPTPLEIYVNDTFLDVDPSYSCFSVGEAYFNVLTGRWEVCQSTQVINSNIKALIRNEALVPVKAWARSILSVRAETAPFKAHESAASWSDYICTDGIPLDMNFESTTENFYLYVTARPCGIGSSTIAYAQACNFKINSYDVATQTYSTERPLFGMINFCTESVRSYVGSSSFSKRRLIRVALHELTHALGFSPFFYNSFINDATGESWPQSPAIRVTQAGFVSPSGQPFTRQFTGLRTPRVVQAYREHIGCDTEPDYVELEDAGSSGTVGAHWEKRLVNNEYMAGYISAEMHVSTLTLALLHDTGWYVPNYLLAEPSWAFGYQKGCGFSGPQCENGWPNSPDPQKTWCSSETAWDRCTQDHNAKGSCTFRSQVQGTASLPIAYQHFSNPRSGGVEQSLDYCPLQQAQVFCTDSTQSITTLGETFSSTSKCFEYTIGNAVNAGFPTTTPLLACLEFRCTGTQAPYGLQFRLASTGSSGWTTCNATNEKKLVTNVLTGAAWTVTCPDPLILCRELHILPAEVIVEDTNAGAEIYTQKKVLLWLSFFSFAYSFFFLF